MPCCYLTSVYELEDNKPWMATTSYWTSGLSEIWVSYYPEYGNLLKIHEKKKFIVEKKFIYYGTVPGSCNFLKYPKCFQNTPKCLSVGSYQVDSNIYDEIYTYKVI